MAFSPFIILIIYLVGVGLFLVISILNIYHIIRFGHSKTMGTITTFVYLGIAVVIILFTFRLISNYDWNEPIEINLPFINSTNDEPEEF